MKINRSVSLFFVAIALSAPRYAKEAVSYETKYFVMKELDIRGSRNATMANFSDVIHVIESGRYPVKETITRCVPFADAGAALAVWAADPSRVTKIHVEL